MSNLHTAIRELKIAKRELEELAASQSQDEIRPHWGRLIIQLRLCFSRLSEAASHDTKKKLIKMRLEEFEKSTHNDEMMDYLHYSRNSYEHVTAELIDVEITDKKPLAIPPHRGLDSQGNKFEAYYYPTAVRLQPIKISGENKQDKKSIAVPKTHRGKDLIGYANPFEIGARGIIFYADFLIRLNKEFFVGKYPDLDQLAERANWTKLLEKSNVYGPTTDFISVASGEEITILPEQNKFPQPSTVAFFDEHNFLGTQPIPYQNGDG